MYLIILNKDRIVLIQMQNVIFYSSSANRIFSATHTIF